MSRNIIIFLVETVLITGIILLAVVSVWIGLTVANACKTAQPLYQSDDCVVALTGLLEDETQPYGQRNDAIWALGQLGDTRALGTLKKYYTGNIPEREPWDETISQYELKKAIALLEGGFNISVPFRPLSLIWLPEK